MRRDGKAGKRRSFRFKVPFLTSFAQDNAHHLYLMTEHGRTVHGHATLGSVYRLVPNRKSVAG